MEEEAKFGIPKATFIEDIDKYLKNPTVDSVSEASQSLDEMYQKYLNIKQVLTEKRVRLGSQIPMLTDTLDTIKKLESKNSDFDLADQLYTKAHIDKADKVYLWIGANVMLEYDLPGAEKIVEKNRDSAVEMLQETADALAFLKDQMTTIEVNRARLHNYSVKLKKDNGPGASEAIKV